MISASPATAASAQKIPATIVTGFLGSGKTTLLRHILQHAAGRRIAVIVNEFGEMGVDGELLRGCGIGCEDTPGTDAGDGSAEGEMAGRVYELANGCLCCTVQEEFYPVMRQLIERRGSIDHILIETSGLALPKPLVQAFQWPDIRNACTVDAVITVVDVPAVAAGQFAAHPESVDAQRRADPNLDHESPLHELFEDQLAAADLVVLTKLDAATGAQAQQVRSIVHAEVPSGVQIVDADHGRLPLDVVLGLGCAAEDGIDARPSHHHHDGEADDHDHGHDAFTTFALTLPAVADRAALLNALATLVRQHVIYRIKGFVAVQGKPMRLVVHGVGTRFDSYFDRPWAGDETPQTRLVCIGQGLDENTQHAIAQTLESALQLPVTRAGG